MQRRVERNVNAMREGSGRKVGSNWRKAKRLHEQCECREQDFCKHAQLFDIELSLSGTILTATSISIEIYASF